MMSNFEWSIDQFDTQILGFKAAKITKIANPSAVIDLVNDLKQKGIEYATFRIRSDQFETIHAMEKVGFLLVDGSISFSVKLGNISPAPDPHILDAKSGDLLKLKKISEDSFNATRFFNDVIIPKKKAQLVYAKWIENSVNGVAAEKVLVYRQDSEIVGYVTINNEHIPLIAVESNIQGKGIGKKLVNAALFFMKENNNKEAYIETQIQNIAAMRVYISCGFKVVDSQFTFRILINK